MRSSCAGPSCRPAPASSGQKNYSAASGESVRDLRFCPTARPEAELYPPSRGMSGQAPLQIPRPMYRNRRLIAMWSVLLLFQWNLLGSGFLCATHQRMGEVGTSGQMALQMPQGSMNAWEVSAAEAPVGAGSCNAAAENTCRTNQLPGGTGCGAMSSCASAAVLSPHAVFPSATGRSTMVAVLVETPLTRSTRPEPRPPRA